MNRQLGNAAGIGLRTPHVARILDECPALGFLEVHPENYMGAPGALRDLERARALYPLSLHAVGLSLGSADGVDATHLARLAELVRRLEPALVSDHLSWSRIGGAVLNDLLPLPYTNECLDIVAANVARVQDVLGRAILVENPSTYLAFRHSEMGEAEFLAGLVRRTGCGILLDLNNLYVGAHNVGLDPDRYLSALPLVAVGEIHLAGHHINHVGTETVLIDDHGSAVAVPVWDLYANVLRRAGPLPTLIEWDTRLPELEVLLGEAAHADALTEARDADAA